MLLKVGLILTECQTARIRMRHRVTRRLTRIQAVCILHYNVGQFSVSELVAYIYRIYGGFCIRSGRSSIPDRPLDTPDLD